MSREDLERDGAAVREQVREVFRWGATLAGRAAEDLGVHPTDLRALRALDAAQRGPLTVGELGARLGLSSAAVSGLVDRLQAAGLARRVPDPRDRRRVLVALTDEAQAFGQRGLLPVAEALDRAVAASDTEGLAAVRRFLEVLLAQPASSASSSAGADTGRRQAKRSQT